MRPTLVVPVAGLAAVLLVAHLDERAAVLRQLVERGKVSPAEAAEAAAIFALIREAGRAHYVAVHGSTAGPLTAVPPRLVEAISSEDAADLLRVTANRVRQLLRVWWMSSGCRI
jgi:hypothetical protein